VSPADLRHKEEERKRAWEIAEKTVREEYTLDWSQSKVFLVYIEMQCKTDRMYFRHVIEYWSTASNLFSLCLRPDRQSTARIIAYFEIADIHILSTGINNA